MDFFDRYSRLCNDHGVKPCSAKAEELFGVTRANITYWRKNRNFPNGETIVKIADTFSVSADYLLCRTDDPTDYTQADSLPQNAKTAAFISRLNRMDAVDKLLVEAYMDGILAGDKYHADENKKTG